MHTLPVLIGFSPRSALQHHYGLFRSCRSCKSTCWCVSVARSKLLVSTRCVRVQGAAETVPASEITTQVLVDMWRDRKTCMGIVAPDGELIGNVSISDLRALTPELFPLLKQPIGAFVLAVRGYSAPEVRTGNDLFAFRCDIF